MKIAALPQVKLVGDPNAIALSLYTHSLEHEPYRTEFEDQARELVRDYRKKGIWELQW